MGTMNPSRLSGRAIRPLTTLDPAGPWDDLGWLDQAIGDARVVAIGESAHFNREFYLLRHRLLRYLVERHGFSAYAMESGFPEGTLADAWVRGGDEQPGRVLATGITTLMGLCTEMRAQLEWMREHNFAAPDQVGFHGIDLPGSSVSLLPGLDAVTAYLAEADPGRDAGPRLRETAASLAAVSVFSAHTAFSAYARLPRDERDALTAGLADLRTRMTARRIGYIRRTSETAYRRALRSLNLTIALDAMVREISRDPGGGLAADIRDAAIADTVEEILCAEDRIVLGAHNNHVQRCPMAIPGVLPASTTMGMHLTARLGPAYLAIGTTSASGKTLALGSDLSTGEFFSDLEPPEPGSLDAFMAASHDTAFAVDLRQLSPTDTEAVRSVTRHRSGSFYGDLAPLDAFDLVVHIPRVTPAEPEDSALGHSSAEVREAFARWQRTSR
ncbi:MULTISPECIES: erythromycin esterase family protein [Amycolatopsis]|uniref:erythromycin esterase family protein n=1 Tax=Amycolatopsis TaxID=1813 RepID=UPI001C57142C|nr:erythromycin esterase family protein [Amycolatopsis sp. TNS106]QXV62622.1 erythromycin esterase [Amycolatopsis sp. TNS106]